MPERLKAQALDQIQLSLMGIEKTKLLACKSMYWPNTTMTLKILLKTCTTYLTFQKTQPKDKMIHYDIPVRL